MWAHVGDGQQCDLRTVEGATTSPWRPAVLRSGLLLLVVGTGGLVEQRGDFGGFSWRVLFLAWLQSPPCHGGRGQQGRRGGGRLSRMRQSSYGSRQMRFAAGNETRRRARHPCGLEFAERLSTPSGSCHAYQRYSSIAIPAATRGLRGPSGDHRRLMECARFSRRPAPWPLPAPWPTGWRPTLNPCCGASTKTSSAPDALLLQGWLLHGGGRDARARWMNTTTWWTC